jgi:hypothetical protein
VRSDQAGVELVIQTASGILTGRFAPREALTILATQAPQARADARRLVIDDADRAGIYAGLVAAVRAELMARPEDRDLRGVVDDLERLERALTAEGS